MNIETLREHCISKNGVTESFPFGEDTLVFKARGKIFALVNLDGDLSINLKCDPVLAIDLRERHSAVILGYHMNKKHWNTVFLDGTIPDKEIFSWIDHSYNLITGKSQIPGIVTRILLAFILSLFIAPSYAQKKNPAPAAPQKTEEGFKFPPLVELKATSVKDQAGTNTCWCFATTSFIESELLRMGKGEYDLSEMFIVRQNLIDKLSDNYLRQGKGNVEEGSLAHDWMRVFTESGIVPDEVYKGLNYGSSTHNHGELQGFINAIAAVPVQRKKESDQYHQIVNAVLDAYLGKVPDSFTYKGVNYTPKSFAVSLGINPADYVEITSFTHFPFYTQGILEITDNWRMERFYNVPLDELIEILDFSLNNGYTVNWDGDVSERGFSHSKGVATFPESNVTQEIRQVGYENFTTTDDHSMHLTGIVKDQNGAKYYITKNSWGPNSNSFSGYLNMSESYVRAKTLFIMVNKNAVPQAIKTKLGL